MPVEEIGMRELKGLKGLGCVGNVSHDVAEQERRGQKGPSWFVGHFQPDGDPRKIDTFEVSVSSQFEGWRRGKWGGQKTAWTFSYVVSGVLQVDFEEESVVLRAGDYVHYGPGVVHHIEVLKDAVWLSCRGPSVSGDSFKLDYSVREV